MIRTRRIPILLVTGALTLGASVLVPPPAASANTSTAPSTTERNRDLSTAKARCTVAIDARLVALTRANGALDAARNLSDAHEAAQTASNTNAASGLAALKSKIATETDGQTLAADCRSIVDDYRVFALRVPQTHLVIAADAEQAAILKLTEAVPKLDDAIAKAAAAGKDVAAATSALADLNAKLADATTKLDGVADAVVTLTPADYNANPEVLGSARGNVRGAASDLKAARADIEIIIATLKG